MGMQEAFNQAARENPGSPVSSDVRGVTRQIREDHLAENQRREFDVLKQRFEIVGSQWFDLITDLLVTAPRKRYLEVKLEGDFSELLKKLHEGKLDERVVLLESLAKSMGLSEDDLPSVYRKSIASWILRNPLQQIQYELKQTHLSHASRLFVGYFAELSGYSEDRLRELDDFIHNRAGLSGRVKLSEVTQSLACWLDKY